MSIETLAQPAKLSAKLIDKGRKRGNNEDFVGLLEPQDPLEQRRSGSLYVLADGVGGADKGGEASRFAVQELLSNYYQLPDTEPGERLRQLMERINAHIHTLAERQSTRIATTMVAAVVRNSYLHLANVGDSRAYLVRAGDARQLTHDHSIVGELVKHHEMTEEEAMTSEVKNRLTRSVGGDAGVTVELYRPLPLMGGDTILLCSDGLTRYARLQDIVRLVTAAAGAEEAARALVDFANASGGADNISVIVVNVELDPTIHLSRARPMDEGLDTDRGRIARASPPPRRRRIWGWVAFAAAALAVAALVGYFAFSFNGVGETAGTATAIFPPTAEPPAEALPAEQPPPSDPTSEAAVPESAPSPLKLEERAGEPFLVVTDRSGLQGLFGPLAGPEYYDAGDNGQFAVYIDQEWAVQVIRYADLTSHRQALLTDDFPGTDWTAAEIEHQLLPVEGRSYSLVLRDPKTNYSTIWQLPLDWTGPPPAPVQSPTPQPVPQPTLEPTIGVEPLAGTGTITCPAGVRLRSDPDGFAFTDGNGVEMAIPAGMRVHAVGKFEAPDAAWWFRIDDAPYGIGLAWIAAECVDISADKASFDALPLLDELGSPANQ